MTEEEANKILKLRPVTFDYDENHGSIKDQRGLIAEEVIEHIPFMVQTTEDENGNQIPENVDYSKSTPYLIKKVQMQEEEINKLKELLNKVIKKVGV